MTRSSDGIIRSAFYKPEGQKGKDGYQPADACDQWEDSVVLERKETFSSHTAVHLRSYIYTHR